MAIFEKTSQASDFLDDTEKLICTVENAQNIDRHTEYNISVQRCGTLESKWTVSHRYSDFAALHGRLQPAGLDLPIPPKKLIGNMHPSFIAERQVALQNYLSEILKHEILALSLPVRNFLDPSNYPSNLAEQALQTVSIALRGDGHYDLKGPLPDIGWRIRKSYFLVTHTQSRQDCLLSWTAHGAARRLPDPQLKAACRSLQGLAHPYIDSILAIQNLESGAYVVRRIHPQGSIRDLLYDADYRRHHLSKYASPKVRRPFTPGQVAHYGYQILQALIYLNDKGIPHGHIHAGNIAIENQQVRLLEIENGLLGVASRQRPWLVQQRRCSSGWAVDAHCFGRTLYEMAYATPLLEATCDIFPSGISEDLESVLLACLGARRECVSLGALLSHPFFSRALLGGPAGGGPGSGGPAGGGPGSGGPAGGRPHLKVPAAVKEALRAAAAAAEERLRAEQKLVRAARREVRIQEILNSEEEIKKLKRKAKRRDSSWKSCSSLADTVRSRSLSGGSGDPPDPPGPPGPPAPPAPPAPRGTADVSASASTSSSASPDGRSALLRAICAFDKTRLAAVDGR